MFECETVKGSHFEMGLQHGRIFKHVIQSNIHQYAMRHTFEGSDVDMDRGLKKTRIAEKKYAPWIFEELNGISKGSGVEYKWIERMHLRVWGAVAKKPYINGGCTGIGMITKNKSIILGGNCDDPRQCYVLIKRIPKKGLPHLQVTWAGSGWGHNGINKSGFALVQASIGCAHIIKLPNEIYGNVSTMTRVLLETCSTVAEAVDLLKQTKPTSSFVLGDKKGNMLMFQGVGPYQSFEEPKNNMLFFSNHIIIKDLTGKIPEYKKYKSAITEYSLKRYQTLENVRNNKNIPKTLDLIKSLLRSHKNFPHSICNNATVMSSITMPMTNPKEMLIVNI